MFDTMFDLATDGIIKLFIGILNTGNSIVIPYKRKLAFITLIDLSD